MIPFWFLHDIAFLLQNIGPYKVLKLLNYRNFFSRFNESI
jgi:hypothetical protein